MTYYVYLQTRLDESLEIKHNTHCPECDCVLPPHYSRKDLRDMSNEAIMRMLKAEKVLMLSYVSKLKYRHIGSKSHAKICFIASRFLSFL